MGYERRGIDATSAQMAENDAHFTEYVYNDVNGPATYGQPLYKDVTDAAEFNSANPTTALVPATQRTGGRVVRGTSANAGPNLTCVGIYQPSSPSETATVGSVVRVLDRGVGIASVQSPAGGAAGNVGSAIIASAAVNDCVPAARATGLNIGVILATRALVAVGGNVVAAASAVAALVNVFVSLA